MKTCRVCQATLTNDSFYSKGGSRTQSWCKACNTVKMREWRARNRDKCRAYGRARYAQNPEPVKARALVYGARNRDKINARARRRVTGWTQEQFDHAWELQGGECAICHVPLRRSRGRGGAAADHDHVTGARRGLLCTQCNCGIGCFRDDPSLAERAAKYLSQWLAGICAATLLVDVLT